MKIYFICMCVYLQVYPIPIKIFLSFMESSINFYSIAFFNANELCLKVFFLTYIVESAGSSFGLCWHSGKEVSLN